MMKKGFTLIEILITMTLLVIIVAATLMIFQSSATSWRKGEIRAQRYQQARFILERMSREISSIVPTSVSGPYCLGTQRTFYFVSTLANTPSSLTEVGYRLDLESKELMRSYQPSPDYDFSTFEDEEVLSEQVATLNFSYFYQDSWQQTWDSRSGAAQEGLLPQAVQINFDILDEKGLHQEAFETIVTLAVAR